MSPASVITCALPYYSGEYTGRNVARYAVCDDYHKTGGSLLEEISCDLSERLPGYTFAPFIDVSPIREVCAAYLSGLGVVGLHGQLITPQWGAWVFIGCIVTNLHISPDHPTGNSCTKCEACLVACPTGALSRDGLRRELCRSEITQKRGTLSAWEEEQVRAGKMAWGCDICLEVCPAGKNPATTPIECLKQNPLPILTPENLGQAILSKAYGYRGRGVLERNLKLIEI